MTKVFISLLMGLLLVATINDSYAGGGRRNGTAGAQELLIPVGARGMAMDGAYITGLKGVEAMFYNPAGLGRTDKSAEALFSHMTYIADIGVSYAAVAVHFEGLGSLGFSIKSLDFGDIPVTTVEAPSGTGAMFSPTYVTMGVSYSNALTDRIQAGVNLKVTSEQIVRTSATVFSFDAGVQYHSLAGVEGLQVAVVLKNLGPQMSFQGPDLLRKATEGTALRGEQYYAVEAESFELPSQLELGVAYQKQVMNDMGLVLSSTFSNNNFSNDEYRLGGELNFKEMFFVRGGYTYMPQVEQDQEQIYGPTFGAGFNLNSGVDIAVDYAYRTTRYFDANHLFSVRFAF